jgi:hypothetical protein
MAHQHDRREYVLNKQHRQTSMLTVWLVIIQVRIAAMFVEYIQQTKTSTDMVLRFSQDRRVIIPVVILFFAQAIGMAVIIAKSFEKMEGA